MRLPIDRVIIGVVSVVLVSGAAVAGGLSADEQKFLDAHVGSIVQIEPTKLTNAALERVFAATFYKVEVKVKQGEGSQTTDATVARVGDELVEISRPSTSEEVPALKKMMSPKFTLKTDKDAKEVEAALDVLYPISTTFGDKDVKAKAIKHTGKDWVFVRGAFFDHHLGFVFTTDAKGAVTGVKFSLELP